MELQINDLVSSIRKDGIEAARLEADSIIAEANRNAEEILNNAKEKAKAIMEDNEKQIEIMRESAKVSAEHAKRDAVLSFKQSVKEEFEKLLSADCEKKLTADVLATLIKAAINGENPADYSAEVAAACDGLKAELAEEIKNGLEIKASKYAKSGFKLAAKDGSGFFDCSDDEIAEMLKPFLPELDF